MIKTAIYALLSIIALAFVRAIFSVISKAVSGAMSDEAPSDRTASAPKPDAPNPSAGGELKKCIVCGTYSPVASAPKIKGIDGFICSDACAARYRG